MKKLLGVSLMVALLSGIAGAYTETLPPASAVGGVPVSNGYDWGLSGSGQPMQLLSKTVAQISVLTPNAAGTVVFCSNCVGSVICVSSGTGAGAWIQVSSGTAGVGTSPLACK